MTKRPLFLAPALIVLLALLADRATAQAPQWIGGGNDFYSVTIDDLGRHEQAGMFTALTGDAHPLTLEWGRIVDVISADRDCATGLGGQDLGLAIIRSYGSHRGYALGANPPFGLVPELGWECLNATELVTPVIEQIDEPASGRGVRGTWLIDSPPDLLQAQVTLAVHGDDWIGSRIEVTVAVTNLGATPTAIGVRTLWEMRYTGKWGGATWDPASLWTCIGERAPDPPAEPFTTVETEWVQPPFRMWEAHGGGAEPSRSNYLYSVAGLMRPLEGLVPQPTPPDFLQLAEMNVHHATPVPGGGAADACFEWHVGASPRSSRFLRSTALATTWGLSDDTALPLPPGERVSVTQYLVAFKTYPLAADVGGPYEATCVGGVASVGLAGSAVLADPTSETVRYEWSSADPSVSFDDPLSPTPIATVRGAGTHSVSLTTTVGVYQAKGDGDITVVDTTAPVISELLATPNSLWPPNHRFVPIRIQARIEDDCDASPSLRLIAVTSNERRNGTGDGDTEVDILSADLGTDDRNVLLRAERSGGGRGREYVLTYEATDASGNASTHSVTVGVSHDQRPSRARPRRP